MKTNRQEKSQTTHTRTNPNTSPMQPSAEELEFFQKLLKQCEIPLLFYMLKTTTDETHAMSVSEISEQLDALIPPPNQDNNYFPERTLRRKLDRLTFLNNSKHPMLQSVNQLLQIILGGKIDYREADGILSGKNTVGNGTQRRYYFAPVLSSGDMNMIFGSIQSNRYLSDEEKSYLLTRLRLLSPSFDYVDDSFDLHRYRHIYETDPLASRPSVSKNKKLPIESSTLLTHIQTIYDAICEEYQLEITYGIYDLEEHTNRLCFRARNKDKAYILNPYAMIWNDGEYYLIATHKNYQNPVHFRIDRILSVVPHVTTDSNGYKCHVMRRPIPPALLPFFKKETDQRPVFDAIQYTNTYQGMRIYHKPHLVDCCFECTAQTLQILIDYFGPELKLNASPIPHPVPTGSDTKPPHYLTATVKNVQYENALGFCLQQAQHLTLLSPIELVNDVKTSLNAIAERYKNIHPDSP